MNYKYSTVNPLKNKQLYMYSDYSGVKFIKCYKQSRNKAILKCKKKLIKNKDKKDILEKISNLDKNNQKVIIKLFLNLLKDKTDFIKKNSNKIQSNIIVDDIDYLFNQLLNEENIEKIKIDNLVKKFEIKKSFSLYIEQSFSKNLLYDDINEMYHLLFSYINSQYFILSKSFKYLSVLLKLNDLLVYKLNTEEFLNTDLLIFALVLELKIFSDIEVEMIGI